MSEGICVCSINSKNGNESRVWDGVGALGRRIDIKNVLKMSRGIYVCSFNSKNENESRVEDGVEAL